MSNPLARLLEDGVIDEVCGRLKSGKEADLWLVRHRQELLAAKVYKARELRSFRNNAGYREGRQVRDTRTQRAIDRGSRFGLAAAEDAWKAKEADALGAFHAAGVRVPKPVLFYEGVLVMELVVDARGHPAPRLVDAHVAREHAAALYADLRAQVVRMLGCDLIHGDLSPYNVLMGHGGPVVIDFPQVIGAAHNSQAESYFVRDLENLRRFFAAIDPALRSAANDAREIWRAYERRELTPDFVPSGKPLEPAARGDRSARQRRQHGAHGRAAEQGRGTSPHHAPGGTRSREPAAPAPPHEAPRRWAESPRQHSSHATGPRQPRRGAPDHRRTGPAPEVIRVARPPLGPTSAAPAAPGPRPAKADGAPGPDAPRSHRRRRRRRR